MSTASPCTMIIFGASGDLTVRKLIPSLYNLECDGLLAEKFAVVGFARSAKDDAQFQREVDEAIQRFSRRKNVAGETRRRFLSRLHYVAGRYDDAEAFGRLKSRVAEVGSGASCAEHLHYLALPPGAAETVLHSMKASGLVAAGGGARIMMEKPFGVDVQSAQRVNRLLGELFGESQVYRVDHYVAKDTIQNLSVFRFANAIFEPIWNYKYIDQVQITAAEAIGVEGRGGYYEGSGVVRDMVQNHVLQVLSLIAMEPPVAGDAASMHNKKLEVFKSIAPILPEDFVFGQYEGYRREPNVDAGSATPTYVALRLFLNNWRWRGVPFYVRAGKSMAKKLTEVVIQFSQAPLCVLPYEEACRQIRPNILAIRIQPDEGIALEFTAKTPGREFNIAQARLAFRYSDFGVALPDAYEQILLDCMRGIPTLFWRDDCVEAAWKAVTPLLAGPSGEAAAAFPNYAPGSWGPAEADALLQSDLRSWIATAPLNAG